jgi:hypothetical protein
MGNQQFVKKNKAPEHKHWNTWQTLYYQGYSCLKTQRANLLYPNPSCMYIFQGR